MWYEVSVVLLSHRYREKSGGGLHVVSRAAHRELNYVKMREPGWLVICLWWVKLQTVGGGGGRRVVFTPTDSAEHVLRGSPFRWGGPFRRAERKGREAKGREGKGKEGKGREGKGREKER